MVSVSTLVIPPVTLTQTTTIQTVSLVPPGAPSTLTLTQFSTFTSNGLTVTVSSIETTTYTPPVSQSTVTVTSIPPPIWMTLTRTLTTTSAGSTTVLTTTFSTLTQSYCPTPPPPSCIPSGGTCSSSGPGCCAFDQKCVNGVCMAGVGGRCSGGKSGSVSTSFVDN
jgi:hypothetical protein